MKIISIARFFLLMAISLGGAWTTPNQHPSQQKADAGIFQVKADGDWEGTLDAGAAKLRLVVHIIRKGAELSATLDSPDQGATGIPIDAISVKGSSIVLDMKSLGATYQGKFNDDGSRIEGEFRQLGQAFPLNFTRVDKSKTETSLLRLEKVDVGGHSINLLVGGDGSPAVIFEGGLGAGIASWSTVQRETATFAQTVSYDRAGVGQSEAGVKPRSAKQIATELRTALQKVGVKPPYLMVGHSLGGIYVRVFADMYPKDVVGMVLIDPSQEAFNDWTKSNLRDLRKEEEGRIAKASEGVRGEWESVEPAMVRRAWPKFPPDFK